MTRHLWSWRIATTEAGLTNGAFAARRIPIPVQGEPMDHTQKNSQSEGGVARHGYKTYKMLWPKLDIGQGGDLQKLVEDAKSGTGELFLTVKWLDSSNSILRFVDLKGRPDLSPLVPDPPMDGMGKPVYSNVVLNVSNITIVNDPASF